MINIKKNYSEGITSKQGRWSKWRVRCGKRAGVQQNNLKLKQLGKAGTEVKYQHQAEYCETTKK